MIRVLIAEDQAMVRGALRALLAMESDIEVVAEVARADEVVSAAMACRPDVALMDIEMPGGDGITSAAALHESLPHCRSLILTTFGKPGFLRRAMETGRTVSCSRTHRQSSSRTPSGARHGASASSIRAWRLLRSVRA